MIKGLKEARITDGLPRVLCEQAEVKALSEAMGTVTGKILDFADKSQVYTDLDKVSETVLDALAVNRKIEWYDTSLDLEQKRRIVKTALETQRLMGTPKAVRLQVSAVHPGSYIEEWFEYGGKTGYFRLIVDITEEGLTDEQRKSLLYGVERTKNVRSRLEEMDYILRPLQVAGVVFAGGSGAIHTRMRVPEGGGT